MSDRILTGEKSMCSVTDVVFFDFHRNLANSFDLHLLSSNQWECVAYQKTSNDPGYFNVANGNVLAAYGFTI